MVAALGGHFPCPPFIDLTIFILVESDGSSFMPVVAAFGGLVPCLFIVISYSLIFAKVLRTGDFLEVLRAGDILEVLILQLKEQRFSFYEGMVHLLLRFLLVLINQSSFK